MLAIVVIAGLVISVVSALESKVSWIEALCSRFGEGCRRTEQFRLFRLPIALWGIVYYAAVAVCALVFEPPLFWLVMGGVGFEFTFVWIMIRLRMFCVFCALNAVVVAVLCGMVFEPGRFWEAAALALFTFIVSHFLILRENAETISGRPPDAAAAEAETLSGKPREAEIAAEIDGEPIELKDVVRPVSQKIYHLEMEIYRIKQERLKKMLRDALLEREAKRRGVSTEELASSVTGGRQSPDPREVEELYRRSRDEFKDTGISEAEVKRHIREQLEEKQKEAALDDFAESLKQRHAVKCFLPEPKFPAVRVSIEGNPAMGPLEAPVVVIEFSDYLCPACRKAHRTAREVREVYGDSIRWVFKDFPLSIHENAFEMALAAHCAEDQGAFWEFQDVLFSMEAEEEEDLRRQAEQLGLDVERFAACLAEERHRSRVERDIREGRSIGITATPTFVINGSIVSGAPSRKGFEDLIDEALKRHPDRSRILRR